MALVACAECGKDVSTQATSCPHCGAPVSSAAVGSPVRTIELTSKRLKLHELFSVLLLLVGLIWTISASQSSAGRDGAGVLPGVLLAAGFVWFVVTRFRIWWHHK